MAFGDSALKKKLNDTLTMLRKGVGAKKADTTGSIKFLEGNRQALTFIFVGLYQLSTKSESAQNDLHKATGLFPGSIAKTKKIEDLQPVGSCTINQDISWSTMNTLLDLAKSLGENVKDKQTVKNVTNDFIGFRNSLNSNGDSTYHPEANSDGDGRTSYRKGNVFGTTGFGGFGKSKKKTTNADDKSSSQSAEDMLEAVVKQYADGPDNKEAWKNLLKSIKALLKKINEPSDITPLSTNNENKEKLRQLNDDYSKLKDLTHITQAMMAQIVAWHLFMTRLYELLSNGINLNAKEINSKKKEILDKINKNTDYKKVLQFGRKTFEFFMICIKSDGKNIIIFVKKGTTVFNTLSGVFKLVGVESYEVAFTDNHRYGGKNDKKKYKKNPEGKIEEDARGKSLIIGKNQYVTLINSDESDESTTIDCNAKYHLTQAPIWEFGDKGHFKDFGNRPGDSKISSKG